MHYGDEICISYLGEKYFILGWNKEGQATIEVVAYDHNSAEVWKYTATTMKEWAEW